MSLSLPGTSNFASGTLVGGRYRLERELGRGGMGVVFLATDLDREQPVAMKILVHGSESSEEVGRRFRREFRAVQRLVHPNVVSVYDYGTFDRLTYFTMEVVEGPNLRTYLDLSPARPDPDGLSTPERLGVVIHVFRQLVTALVAIHSQRIIHRDLKPSNILVNGAGQLKIMDFGLVRAVDEDASRLTRQGIVVGTVAYMSPEQAVGGRMDLRSDLYSVGVMLYEALAGRRPFLDPTVTGLLLKQVHERPFPVSAYSPRVPPPLEALAGRLLEKDPFARFQSSEELVDALDSVASDLAGAMSLAGTSSETTAGRYASGQRLLPPRFVGREEELQRLRSHVEALASRRSGELVLVGGESGIGKSRLLEEIRGLGRLHQIQFLRGQCFEGSIAPYSVFLGPLERLAEGLARRTIGEQRAAVGREGRALVQLSPRFLELDAVAELPALESLPPAQERYRVFSAVTSLLRNLAERRPLALILEDLQWADQLSMDLLAHLVRNLVHPVQEPDSPRVVVPVLILATYRDDEIQEHPFRAFIAQLRRQQQVDQIVLARLDLEQVGRFLQSMLAMDEPPRNLALRIFQESEGNPFFVEEILKSLLDDGILKRDARGWILDYDVSTETSSLEAGQLYAHLRIPASIQDAVNKRLERLEPARQKILASAALIGREFSFDLLLEIAEIDEDRLLDAVDNFLKNGVIVERPGARDFFDFYHAKIREVLYGRLRPRERVRHHRKIAVAAERLYAGRLDEHYEFLAHHCFEAGLQEKAVEYSYRAGRQLQERYLNEAAIDHFRRALAILNARTEPLGASEVLTKLNCYHALGQVLLHIGLVSAAAEAFRKMNSEASSAQVLASQAWAHLGLSQSELRLGNYAAATELLRAARDQFIESNEVLGLAYSHKVLAGVETFQHRFGEAGEEYGRALSLFERLGVKQELAAVLGDIGVNWHQQRRLQAAETAYRRSLELHRELGDKAGLARVLINLAVTCMEQGQYAAAFETLRDAIRLNQEVGHRANLAACYQNQGLFYLNLGEYSEALDACARAAALSEEIGQRYYHCQVLSNQGAVFLALGDLGPARETLQRSLGIAREIGVEAHAAHTLLKLARLAELEAGPVEAVALYREALAAGAAGQDDEATSRATLRLIRLGIDDSVSQNAVEPLLDTARSTGSREYQTEVLLDAAAIYESSGNFALAEALALEALGLSEESGLRESRVLAFARLASIALHRDDGLAAQRYAEALSALEDMLEHIPEQSLRTFIARADLSAILHASLVLSDRLQSGPLRTALAAFKPREEGELTATVASTASTASVASDGDPTTLIDYHRVGVPGPRQP